MPVLVTVNLNNIDWHHETYTSYSIGFQETSNSKHSSTRKINGKHRVRCSAVLTIILLMSADVKKTYSNSCTRFNIHYTFSTHTSPGP